MNHVELNSQVLQMKDGFFQLDKDKEAIKLFSAEVEEKTLSFLSVGDRIQYMLEHDYYYPELLKHYSLEQIEELHHMLYSFQFTFKSYMAISKFYKDYALKTNDGKQYLEDYEQRVAIVSLYLAQGDFVKAKLYAHFIGKQCLQPATPTFLNAGRSRRGEMISCFLLELDDTLNSIGFNINQSMQLSKLGGGVALNLSKLRARGEEIKGIEGAASGVIPVTKLLEDSFSYADQLGQRKGAGAAYLNIFHWDIIPFLDTKKITADEKVRLQSLSIGVIASSIFFDLAKRNEDMYVFAPYSVYKEYGIHLDDIDIDVMYYELLKNPNIKKKSLDMTAREMLVKIATIQLESGYPYFMFKTNANEQHPLKDIGQVKMSNLCTEIFQLMETSEITDYGLEDKIKHDINCTLASLNIANVMAEKDIFGPVDAGMRLLTSVSQTSYIPNAPAINKAKDDFHAVGLGAMNLHGYLVSQGISYTSPEGRDFARTFFMVMNYASILTSMQIAKEEGETFKDFEKSEYANGNYFVRYIETDYKPQTDKVKELFEGMFVPSQEDWKSLSILVKTYGLYHGYRLAIAPTQSISYVQNATSSVMPIVEQIETRKYANATTCYPMPFLSPETYFLYESAYDMNQMDIIDMIAEIQPHIDQGISTILYVNSDVPTNLLGRYYAYAHYKGLKSLYYTRTRKLDVDECLSCSV